MSSIVQRYLPEALRPFWVASFNAALQGEFVPTKEAPLAPLFTQKRKLDENAWRNAQRGAISTLLAHNVQLSDFVDESTKDNDLFLPQRRS